MKLVWQVDPKDIERIRAFYEGYQDDPFVSDRRRRNLAEQKPPLTKAGVWQTLVACLLSTQQRSGPHSAVSRLMGERPFPLSYDQCLQQPDVKFWTSRLLRDFGGIRRHAIIADQISENLAKLEQSLWADTMLALDKLRLTVGPQAERETAMFIYQNFKGFGPKQSRNLLQSLGLSRYETPIDSRIIKWLNEFGFPVRLTAGSLSDPAYYDLVSDGFQALCLQSSLFPCLLDAAIFTSFDKGGWTEENVVW